MHTRVFSLMAFPEGLNKVCDSLYSKCRFALLELKSMVSLFLHILACALYSLEVFCSDLANDFGRVFLKSSVYRLGTFCPGTHPILKGTSFPLQDVTGNIKMLSEEDIAQ